MVFLGEIISIMGGIKLLSAILCGMLLIIVLLIHKKKLWKANLLFLLFLPLAFGRLEGMSDFTHIDSDRIYQVIGKVNKVTKKEDYSQVFLENAEITGNEVGGVIINYSGKKALMPGDIVAYEGKISNYDVARNPGNFNMRLYYASQNITLRAGTHDLEIVEKCNNPWIISIFALKDRLINVYKKISVENDAGVYISIFLGNKALLDGDIKELYQVNGMAHILAISGLHVSIIGMGLYKLLRKCMLPFLPSFVVCFVIIISYGIMTGNSISTIRAISMFVVATFAAVIGRSYDLVSALALSAISIILVYPKVIYNSGFWLSFLAVLGICVIKPAIDTAIGNDRAKSNDRISVKILKFFLDGLTSSLAVNIATVPVILYSYYELPIYSVFLNMLVIPLMGFLMVSVVVGGFAGLLWLPAGAFCIGVAHYILVFYQWICRIFMKLPYAVVVLGQPALWQIIIYYVIVAGATGLTYYVSVREQKIIKPLYAMLVGVVMSLLVLVIRFSPDCRIRFLDVGQGDGIHISSEGINMLVDGGSSSVESVGKYRIIPYLKSQAVTQIDYMVATHEDMDHISGLVEILNDPQFKVRYLILSSVAKNHKNMFYETEDKENLEQLCEAADNAGTKVLYISSGQSFKCGEIDVLCLHPSKGYAAESGNDSSLVLQLTYKGVSTLLTGDVEEAGERFMYEKGYIKAVEILKVAHHGSRYSSCTEFLTKASPKVAIISCLKGNSYGHPHKETLDRLSQIGCKVLTTMECGAITVEINKNVSIYGYLN